MQKNGLSIDFKYIVRNIILSKNAQKAFPCKSPFGFNLRIIYESMLNKIFLMFRIDLINFF